MIKKLFVVMAAVLILPMAARADIIPVTGSDLIGFRTTPKGSGLIATDGWTDGDEGGVKIAWDISQIGGTWHYQYTFTDKDGSAFVPDMSHWVLEVSPNITKENFADYIDPRNFETDDLLWEENKDGIPNIHGIKMEVDSSEVGGVYEFWSPRMPVWGDFYGKGGKHDGVVATVYNTGKGTDPSYAPSYDEDYFTNWIPTVDTDTDPVIPEPGTLLLLGSGLMGFAGYGKLRFRRRKKT